MLLLAGQPFENAGCFPAKVATVYPFKSSAKRSLHFAVPEEADLIIALSSSHHWQIEQWDSRFAEKVELINENGFDVLVTGVEGFLFGDAVTFFPVTAEQLISAGEMTALILGEVEFTGGSRDYTFADFSIITASNHPGLGPEFSANFQVVSAPATLTLLALGLLALARFGGRNRLPNIQAGVRFLWPGKAERMAEI